MFNPDGLRPRVNVALCMSVRLSYVRLEPESLRLPSVEELRPFRAVVIVEAVVSPSWQAAVSEWLVRSGCLYMMAWGRECSSWDDSVDAANLEEFEYRDIPEERFVMTTWHESDSLPEVFWFSKNSAFHPTVKLLSTLLLHVSSEARESEFRAAYASA